MTLNPLFTLVLVLSTLYTLIASTPLVSVLESFPVKYPTRTDVITSEHEAVSIMNANLDYYFSKFRKADFTATEILVLPEDGLYGDEFTPHNNVTWELLANFQIELPSHGQEGKVNLCPKVNDPQDTHPTLRKIACEAKKRGIWIVVNLADFQNGFRYNTVLVVDPQGYFQGKYHKRHLFPDDLALFSPGEKRVQTFTVDGQHIGLMICFDIFFSEPARQLVQQQKVDAILFSTYWVNTGTVPYISAVNMQQAFSRAYNVLLYASNMNVGYIDSGSGIYNAGKIVAYTFNTKRGKMITKVLRSDGKVFGQEQSEHVGGMEHDSRDVSDPRVAPLRNVPNIAKVQPFVASAGLSRQFSYKNENQDNLHCQLNVTIANDSPATNEVFAFVAYTGDFFEPLPVQLCGLIRCRTVNDCFTNKFELSSRTAFESFDLVVEFDAQRNASSTPAFPIISTNDAQLLNVDTFDTDCLNKLHLQKPGTVLLNAFLFKSFA